MFGMTKDIGIDLGTANTLVYHEGQGYHYPRAFGGCSGQEAPVPCATWARKPRTSSARTPGSIVAVRPLKDGVIADFDMTSSMLEQFIKKALRGRCARPRVIICIPSGVTAGRAPRR